MKKKKRLTFVILIAWTLMFMMTSVAYGYTTTGQTIATGNSLAFKLNSGFTSLSSTHFSNGISAWNAASGRTLMSKSSSTHTATNYPNNDSNNYVYRVDTGTGDYLGQTTWWYSNNLTTQADININMHYSWANSAQSGYYDTGSVLYHEQGHVVGLNHSATNTAVMYASLASNTVKRTLTQDDINGADSLY